MNKKRLCYGGSWLILSEEDFCLPVITDEHHGAGAKAAGQGGRDWASAWDSASDLL